MEIKRMVESSADGVPDPLDREEIERVLALLLASPLFAKSRRMGSLLRFLVEYDLQFSNTSPNRTRHRHRCVSSGSCGVLHGR